jgi:hypothetical protein
MGKPNEMAVARVSRLRRGPARRKFREVRLDARGEGRRVASGEADDEVRLRVVVAVEGAHVFERELLK